MDGVEPPETIASAPQRLTGTDALKAHVTLAIGVTLCALAFWFEIGRAERGNSLSWAYVFEWPLLALFAVYMWWKTLHPDWLARKGRRTKAPTIAPEYAGMLEAWQDHQRELSASEGRAIPADTDQRGDEE